MGESDPFTVRDLPLREATDKEIFERARLDDVGAGAWAIGPHAFDSIEVFNRGLPVRRWRFGEPDAGTALVAPGEVRVVFSRWAGEHLIVDREEFRVAELGHELVLEYPSTK